MVRRLFLVELDPTKLAREIKDRVDHIDEFLITETFIPKENEKELIQLLSSTRLPADVNNLDQRWAKADFRVLSSGWRLEKLSPRIEISSEEYYKLLLTEKNAAVEQKVRTVFHINGNRYSVEINGERNYSVIQIDYNGDPKIPYEKLFESMQTITVVGELFMSLEETFCRLYLKKSKSLEESRAFDIES